MKEPDYVWFLLGVKPMEMLLMVFAMGWSRKHPELATEHEPRALTVLKKQIPETEDTKGFKFHACRLTIYSDDSLDRIHSHKESKRWRDEFRRFLARSGLTLVEQKEMMEPVAESMLNLIRETDDAAVSIRPLSQSLWGKAGKVQIK